MALSGWSTSANTSSATEPYLCGALTSLVNTYLTTNPAVLSDLTVLVAKAGFGCALDRDLFVYIVPHAACFFEWKSIWFSLKGTKWCPCLALVWPCMPTFSVSGSVRWKLFLEIDSASLLLWETGMCKMWPAWDPAVINPSACSIANWGVCLVYNSTAGTKYMRKGPVLFPTCVQSLPNSFPYAASDLP